MNLYPLQFKPIFKDRIWGGQKLKTVLNKPITSSSTGESWELSAVEGEVSQVSNGYYQGKTLTDMIEHYPNELLGDSVYARFGKQFPLLIKFLDAKEDLSIQVHPNDDLAKARHNSFGKTEMWYVVQADENAEIIVGFKETSNPTTYLKHLENKEVLSLLDTIKVKPGDVFFLDTGTVHAIGAGLVIAEIQQTSDITYRIYDFEREDSQGKQRELHNDLALEAINYNKIEARRTYKSENNQSNSIVECPFFTTDFLPISGRINKGNHAGSFTILMCVEGSFELEFETIKYGYRKGDTVLLPAAITSYFLEGNASLLEIYIS